MRLFSVVAFWHLMADRFLSFTSSMMSMVGSSSWFVELQERLQLDRIGVGAGPFSWCLLGVMDFLFAVRFLPGLFGFGDPVLVIAS